MKAVGNSTEAAETGSSDSNAVENSTPTPPAEPPWLADLPRFGPQTAHDKPRGQRYQRLPLLASTAPATAAHNSPRSFALAFRRRCLLCGCAVPEGHYWRVLYYSLQERGPVEHPGGVTTAITPGPIMHKSCAVYAALVCPFLRYPTSRRPSLRHVTRGDIEIARYRSYGIAFFGPPAAAPYTDETPWNSEDRWAYVDHIETIRFETWRDLLPLYEQAVAADAKIIDMSTRLFWADGDRRLDRYIHWDNIQLARLRATAPTQPGGYRLALL